MRIQVKDRGKIKKKNKLGGRKKPKKGIKTGREPNQGFCLEGREIENVSRR